MSDNTPRLGLPELAQMQEMNSAQINEALIQLDVLSCACFKDQFVNTPPATPADGDTYLLGGAPNGTWTGYAYKIAYCIDGGWRFYTPFDGLRALVLSSGAFIYYHGGSWSDFAPTVTIPSFAADRDGSDQAGLTTNATNTIAFDHVAEDNKGWFDTTTGRYTPQQAGLYMIVLGVALTFSGSPSDSPQAYIYKNGSLLINGSYVGLAGGASGAGSMAFGLVRFNGSSDYVDGRCFVPSGTATIRGGISQTFLQGFWVGS